MRIVWAVTLIVAVMALAGAASAQVTIFNGDQAHVAGLTLGGWGSGTAVESADRVYTGNRAVKVTTQGLHEGGRIDLRNPVPLVGQSYTDDQYVQFVLSFTTVQPMTAGGSPMGPGFGATMAGPGGMPGGFYGGYGQEFEIPSRPRVNTVRVALESADGKRVDATSDVPTRTDEGWYKIAIPYKAFGFKQGEPFNVSRVMIFTDIPETLYVGQIAGIRDSEPISIITPGDDQVVAVYDLVILHAEADGGATMVRYAWNFGDRDPDGEDATGELITHRFRKGGDYDVKLTISDVWGIKDPVTATVRIAVID